MLKELLPLVFSLSLWEPVLEPTLKDFAFLSVVYDFHSLRGNHSNFTDGGDLRYSARCMHDGTEVYMMSFHVMG